MALDVRDLESEGDDATADVARSKTDQKGAGGHRFVSRDTDARVRAWLSAASLEGAQGSCRCRPKSDRQGQSGGRGSQERTAG